MLLGLWSFFHNNVVALVLSLADDVESLRILLGRGLRKWIYIQVVVLLALDRIVLRFIALIVVAVQVSLCLRSERFEICVVQRLLLLLTISIKLLVLLDISNLELLLLLLLLLGLLGKFLTLQNWGSSIV